MEEAAAPSSCRPRRRRHPRLTQRVTCAAGPPTGSDFFASIATLYAVQPDITACQAGQLKAEVGARVLAVLNDIRAEHALPPVQYAAADEAGAMQSSLIMAANGQLSHTPPSSWNCYTSLGASVAGQANLYGGLGNGLRYTSNDDLVIGWADRCRQSRRGQCRPPPLAALSVPGHGLLRPRRRALPELEPLGRGDAEGHQRRHRDPPEPAAHRRLSLRGLSGALFRHARAAVLQRDRRSAHHFGANAAVNFSAATVSVRQRGGAAMAVSRVRFDNDGYGLPNNIQFAAAGLASNVTYDVTIDRVGVGGTLRTFTYYFRLVP
ncbi:MAG: CAP domain-containing protein [Sphingomonas sp.]